MIRYLVRLRGRGWISVLLLGLAFATFEEFLVVQTSVSPYILASLGSSESYGRLFGVDWVYFLWAAGYEGIWGIVLPIYLTELIFPNRRTDRWLGRLGGSTVALVFFLSSVVSWYVWTQIVAPPVIGFVYSPAPSLVVFACAVVVLLGMAALGPRGRPPLGRATTTRAPTPRLLGAGAFLASLLWFAVVAFAAGLFPAIPAVFPIGGGLVLGAATFLSVSKLSVRSGWGDSHRFATVFGGLSASMLAGFWASGLVLAIDYIGKAAFDGIAVCLLLYLSSRLKASDLKLDGAVSEGAPRNAKASVRLLGRLKPQRADEPPPM